MTAVPDNRFVSPLTAVTLALRNPFSVSGRSSRGAFWWYAVVVVSTGAALSVWSGAVFALFSYLVFFPTVSVFVRRLHDVSISAVRFGLLTVLWYVFAFIVAVACSILLSGLPLLILVAALLIAPMIVAFAICAAKGDRRTNMFDADVETGQN